MVQQTSLDRRFAALADPTRRGVLDRLGDGPATVSELSERFGMTLTGMRKHLVVLEELGLVVTEKVGRVRQCRLGREGLGSVLEWIEHYQRLWERRLDGLELYLTLRNAQGEHAHDSTAQGES
jgi:DNA-binding transcriptional ArsR family regulator